MNGRVDWDLLTMYVFGECSEDQEKAVERWLAEDPVREDVLDDLREVYGSTGKTPDQRARDERRQDRTWAQVEAHMQQEAGRQQEADPPSTTGRSARRGSVRRGRVSRRVRRSVLRVTAVLAAVALLSVLVEQFRPGQVPSEPDSEKKTFVTQRGERATIQLADSTHVRLNADSKLKVLPGFETGAREVRLQGEAYFEVVPDASRPFVVDAGLATTEVLGTEFAVNTYAGSAEVVVAEGKVAVRLRDGAQEEISQEDSQEKAAQKETTPGEVVLTRRQATTLGPDKQLAIREVNLDRHLAWLRGELVFEDAAFSEVAQRLERRYNIDVSLVGPATRGQLTARFSAEQSLRKVLTVVAAVFDLKKKRKGKVVTFSAVDEGAP